MISLKELVIPFYQSIFTNFFGEKFVMPVGKKNAFVFLSPDYGNIGDMAIDLAEQQFLRDNLNNYNVIPITVADTYRYLKSIRRQLGETDLIFFVGGGNFGDLYPKADFGRIYLVKYFLNYRICSLPQTMLFTTTKYGQRRLTKTKKAFAKHSRLTLFARESVSYELMKKEFDCAVLFSPDIVFYLLEAIQDQNDLERKQVTLTFRHDEEKLLSASQEKRVIDILKASTEKLVLRDTAITNDVYLPGENAGYVEGILTSYRQSKLVVTDRLHGMIFAVITGTPCIVFSNSNHKILGTYTDWLKGCNYVMFIDPEDEDQLARVVANYMSSSFKPNYRSFSLPFGPLSSYLDEVTR